MAFVARNVACFVFCSLDSPKWIAGGCARCANGVRHAIIHGFVFRVTRQDLPASLGHWGQDANEKPLTTMAQIEAEFENTILFRIGERHCGYNIEANLKHGHEFEQIGRENRRAPAAALSRNPAR